jgi:hypothetical protein
MLVAKMKVGAESECRGQQKHIGNIQFKQFLVPVLADFE